MNLLAHVAELARQHQLHLRVDVLDAFLDDELAFHGLFVDGAQLTQEQGQLVLADEAYRFQHGDVGHRAQHVVGREVEVHLAVAAYGKALNLAVDLKVFLPKLHEIYELRILI